MDAQAPTTTLLDYLFVGSNEIEKAAISFFLDSETANKQIHFLPYKFHYILTLKIMNHLPRGLY